MNRKQMWQLTKDIEAGLPLMEHFKCFTIGDVRNKADVERLKSLDWYETGPGYLEWRDGNLVHGVDFQVSIPEPSPDNPIFRPDTIFDLDGEKGAALWGVGTE